MRAVGIELRHRRRALRARRIDRQRDRATHRHLQAQRVIAQGEVAHRKVGIAGRVEPRLALTRAELESGVAECPSCAQKHGILAIGGGRDIGLAATGAERAIAAAQAEDAADARDRQVGGLEPGIVAGAVELGAHFAVAGIDLLMAVAHLRCLHGERFEPTDRLIEHEQAFCAVIALINEDRFFRGDAVGGIQFGVRQADHAPSIDP